MGDMGDICGRRGGRDVVKKDEGRAGFEQRERPRFVCTCVRKCTPAIDHGRDLASKLIKAHLSISLWSDLASNGLLPPSLFLGSWSSLVSLVDHLHIVPCLVAVHPPVVLS